MNNAIIDAEYKVISERQQPTRNPEPFGFSADFEHDTNDAVELGSLATVMLYASFTMATCSVVAGLTWALATYVNVLTMPI